MHRRRRNEDNTPPPDPRVVAQTEAQSKLDSLVEAGDDLVTADFIDKNIGFLSYREDTRHRSSDARPGSIFYGARRGRSPQSLAKREYQRQSRELRRNFNDPKRRQKDRAALHRQSGRSTTSVSGLFEKAAERRRRSRNTGGLSTADVLGL